MPQEMDSSLPKTIPGVRVPFVDLFAQFKSIRAELESSALRVLSKCNFILGSEVAHFEEAFGNFIGVSHAIGVSSGLDALRLALAACGIGSGDEVIVPANTYIATALAVSAVGARPVFVDCDRTFNIDPSKIEDAITLRTKAVIPVHLAGQAADMDPILSISARRGLIVIEDAAQAHGAMYRSHMCGSMSLASCFSFYPGKNLGAAGDGGLVATNSAEVAEKVRQLRNYGEARKYENVEKGLNARLDTIQAAILSAKLPHLPHWNRARAAHAELYQKLLSTVKGVGFQGSVSGAAHVFHLFMIEVAHRDSLRQHLREHGIETGIHYPTPIHLQKAYSDLGYRRGDFPMSERLSERILSLPMFPELTDEQILLVSDRVREFVTRVH